VDDLGNLKVLDWSGQETFRLTMDGPQRDYTKDTLQINYLMFVPAPPSAVTLINPGRVGNLFSVSFNSESAVAYTLQYKNSLSDAQWTDTPSSTVGNGGLKTLTDTSTEAYRSTGSPPINTARIELD